MQSNDTLSKVTNGPIAIDDLVAMMEASGWEASQNKSYWKVLSKGDMVITLALEKGDFDLKCIDIYNNITVVSLSKISIINPYPLMTVLHCYGIVDLKTLAEAGGMDVENFTGLEDFSKWSL